MGGSGKLDFREEYLGRMVPRGVSGVRRQQWATGWFNALEKLPTPAGLGDESPRPHTSVIATPRLNGGDMVVPSRKSDGIGRGA